MTIIYQGTCPSCSSLVAVRAEVPDHVRKDTIPSEMVDVCSVCRTSVRLSKPLAIDLLAINKITPEGGRK